MFCKVTNCFRIMTLRAWVKFIFFILLLATLDQYSKKLITDSFLYGETHTLIPGFFDLTLAFNKGAAFGFLSGVSDGYREVILGLFTALALFVVMYFLLFEYATNKVAQFALALIIGGALGNIIDRARLGMVVDFLDFYFKDYHYPAFNFADSFICVGVFILLFARGRKAEESQ